MDTLPDTFHQLRDQVVPLLSPYVSRIRVFGSVARGEASSASDIDLLVTLKPMNERPPLGLAWFALEYELSTRLGHQVEMVTEEAVSLYLRPFRARCREGRHHSP